MRMIPICIFVLWAAVGCDSGSASGGGGGGDADSDADSDTNSDADGDSDSDADTDTDTDSDSDADTDGMVACANGEGQLDIATDICWKNPPSSYMMEWEDAVAYCEDGSWGGHTDWYLPDIEEMVTLLRGCVEGEETDDLSKSHCVMTPEGCDVADSCTGTTSCGSCNWNPPGGPGPGGCYWHPDLSGECLVTASSSTYGADDGDTWVVYFSLAWVDYRDKYGSSFVRCARPGP